ncbi:MAG TPA: SoxR reducing system RseC family protein [Rhodocyclaceae bacterium]|nr:SoxR reducing system RseC family protein [Rhodocyclaceae bacterium]HNH34294.1 SoxR reducing system RseC family protein [Rhodocyclaceae bacterium]
MSQDSEAIVIEVRGDAMIVQLTKPVAGCGRCEEVGGCSSGLFGRKCRTYSLPNDLGMSVGDSVRVSVADGTVFKASMVSYLMPALLAIGGGAAGDAHGGDGWAVAGSLAGLAAGFLFLRLVGSGRNGGPGRPIIHIRPARAVAAFERESGNPS